MNNDQFEGVERRRRNKWGAPYIPDRVLVDIDGLLIEVERLRGAIERHRQASTPKTPEARRFYGPPNMTDQVLWSVLDEAR
jgi:hypothetical protein